MKCQQRGQVIVEALLIFPLAFFFMLACLDLQLCMQDLGALSYAAQQTAVCAANANAACPDTTAFAVAIVQGTAFVDTAQLTVTTSYPSGTTARVQLVYPFHPLGLWFPSITLQRVATAVKGS
jgi:hypothetical protein